MCHNIFAHLSFPAAFSCPFCSLLLRFVNDTFDPDQASTIGRYLVMVMPPPLIPFVFILR